MTQSRDRDPQHGAGAPPRKGRGAALSPAPRFDDLAREPFDDGWGGAEGDAAPQTVVIPDTARRVLVRNDSPDVPFAQSINPYRGCEHGCSYCFARPTHAYLGLSPGLDFETRIACKSDAAQRLREELAAPSYRCEPIALGVNTDAYQPLERRLQITRSILEVLRETRHPVSIVTKSALIERDLDLLAEMSRERLVHVVVSVTTLDAALARRMEPRAAAPARRIETIARLARSGIPVGVNFAPLIPALNDHEMESILERAREAGARAAGYILLRLPHELREMFPAWLEAHYPARAAHVASLMRQLHEGRLYSAEFGKRQRGSGTLADLVERRFELACRRLNLNDDWPELDSSRFRPPAGPGGQLPLL